MRTSLLPPLMRSSTWKLFLTLIAFAGNLLKKSRTSKYGNLICLPCWVSQILTSQNMRMTKNCKRINFPWRTAPSTRTDILKYILSLRSKGGWPQIPWSAPKVLDLTQAFWECQQYMKQKMKAILKMKSKGRRRSTKRNCHT